MTASTIITIIAFLLLADGLIGLVNFNWFKTRFKMIQRSEKLIKMILVLELIIGSFTLAYIYM